MSERNNNNGWGITCQCGHFDDYDKFEVPENGGYQCPECGVEWQIDYRVLPDSKLFGFIVINDN